MMPGLPCGAAWRRCCAAVRWRCCRGSWPALLPRLLAGAAERPLGGGSSWPALLPQLLAGAAAPSAGWRCCGDRWSAMPLGRSCCGGAAAGDALLP